MLEASLLISSTCGIHGSLSSSCCPFLIIVTGSPFNPAVDHVLGIILPDTVDPNLID